MIRRSAIKTLDPAPAGRFCRGLVLGIHDWVSMGLAADIAVVIVAGLLGGALAHKLRQPLLLGYILAGVVVGPHTGGVTVANIHDLELLAEIGVALLLFALGLEFSLRDLRSLARIAIGGTTLQLVATFAWGYGLAVLLDWPHTTGVWFGAMVAMSSTMVVLKTLGARGQTGSLAGRVMIGMLIAQDVAVLPLMILLPSVGDPSANLADVGWAVLKGAVLVVAMVVTGRRLIPLLIRTIASWNSRELFALAVVAMGLGIGYATSLMGLSFAIGAFVAGVVLSETEFSHQALSDVIPLRDIFGLLFFVSVGMLFDPAYLYANLNVVAVVTGIIAVAKFAIFAALVRIFGYGWQTATAVGLGLFQIGEFSFVIARAGLGTGAIDAEVYHLVLTTSIATMLLTPIAFRLAPVLARVLGRAGSAGGPPAEIVNTNTGTLRDHVIVAGGGRVGQYVARILSRLSTPFVVIEFDHARTQQIQAAGLPLIYGDAAQPPVLEAAGIDRAQLLLITTPTVVSAQSIVRSARARAPKVRIVARAESSDQMKVLHDMGVYEVVQPEFEAGLEITRQALLHLQIPASEIQRFTDAVRRELYAPLAQQSDAGRFIAALHDAARLLELRWLTVSASAPAAGQTIGALQIRSRYGASIVGLLRAGRLIPNPGADELLLGGDHVAVMGARAQTDAVAALLSSPEEAKAVQEGPAG